MGSIVHYDGNNWTKIDFDQQWSFTAVTGDPVSGMAYAVGRNTNFNPIILKLSGNFPEVIYQSKQQATALKSYDIKYLDGWLYMAGSDFSTTLLWKYNVTTKNVDSLQTLAPTTSIIKTTGEKTIDMYFWGRDYDFGKMVHYNGKRYKIFNLDKTSDNSGSAATKGDVSAFVGQSNNKGYITIVKRIKQ